MFSPKKCQVLKEYVNNLSHFTQKTIPGQKIVKKNSYLLNLYLMFIATLKGV
jgi:hypothetical protein